MEKWVFTLYTAARFTDQCTFDAVTWRCRRSCCVSSPQVKVWNTNSGLCFVTFTEHTSSISSVTFTSSGFVIVSASLDGTVRAFDLHR